MFYFYLLVNDCLRGVIVDLILVFCFCVGGYGFKDFVRVIVVIWCYGCYCLY